MQRDPIVAHISELMKIDKMLTKDELKAGKVSERSLCCCRLFSLPKIRPLTGLSAARRTRSPSPSSVPSRMRRRRPRSRRHPLPPRGSERARSRLASHAYPSVETASSECKGTASFSARAAKGERLDLRGVVTQRIGKAKGRCGSTCPQPLSFSFVHRLVSTTARTEGLERC